MRILHKELRSTLYSKWIEIKANIVTKVAKIIKLYKLWGTKTSGGIKFIILETKKNDLNAVDGI